MVDKVVLATGGFDPLHSGHIQYLNAAKELGDTLVVGVNSDEWISRKKGLPFMNLKERMSVVGALKPVDEVISFGDSDGSSIDAIRYCLKQYPDAIIVFVNGGDRGSNNVPETSYNDERLQFAFGVGGNEKVNSSSWILNEYKENVEKS